ncbi:G-protein coupled receptor Mth2-like [Anoplolepis gracilipes]|uniref:G-protein coupled receptor Mth2-like n=1 Tax=Anoplolepis gracilipes TaxID=354296 RepID=UPI003B9E4994
MYDKSFEFLCCALLFFASSTEPLRNFIIDSNSRNELHGNSTEKNDNGTISNRYSLRKNFTMDYENAQDVFRINSSGNDRKDDDLFHYEPLVRYVKYHEKRNQMRRELRMNFTKIDNKKYSINENDNQNYVVPHKKCDNVTCIRLCCLLSDRYEYFRNCNAEGPEHVFSDVYNSWIETNMKTEHKKIDEMFQLIVQDPCSNDTEIVRISLNDDSFGLNKYIFFENGTLFLPYFDQFFESTSYCLAFSNQDQVDAVICSKTLKQAVKKEKDYFIAVIKPVIGRMYIFSWICTIVSTLFMFIIFLMYNILPELHNIHSFMLRRYSSMMLIYYISKMLVVLIGEKNLAYSISIASGLFTYFSDLSCFFWLSAMSFDMWWTFRDFRLSTKKVEQQARKKFLYSIIAWGIPCILTTICIIMIFVPGVPKNIIRPKFYVTTCWFPIGAAYLLYDYGPKVICTVISVFLSIQTALKIARYEKDTARCLNNSESRCYNENKKWANLYLKLFIMLFVIIAMEWIIITTLVFGLFKDISLTKTYVAFGMCILEIMKDIGIFTIFVCKKTIMQLLLKHFCKNHQHAFKIFTCSSYTLKDINHGVKHNNSMEKYQQSKRMDKEFT